MTTLQDVIDAIDAAERAEERVEALGEKFVAERFGVKVGDIVTVNTYSHNGKKMRVHKAYVRLSGGGWEVAALGNVLKKNGEESKHIAQWRERVSE